MHPEPLAAPREPALAPGALVEEAAAIAGVLRAHARPVRGGGVAWLAAPREGAPPAVLGPHLYDGTVGIALFLAAVDRVRGGDEWRELALLAVAPLRRLLGELVRDPERARGTRLGIGGVAGLGSFIYGMARVAEWTGDDALPGELSAATVLFTPARVEADEQLDVVAGAAGAILALLALERVAPGAAPAEIAAACADHLLARRVSHQGRPRAWPAAGSSPLSGFAHGASGIGCALLRLYARTGDAALRDAALEGFEYERSLFDAGAENWLDPRFGRLLEQSAWCHGAPGMVLARLEAVRAGAADAAVLDDLALTLRLAGALPAISLDHLCCGMLGRAEILLCADRVLGGGELLAAAHEIAAAVLHRARENGGFSLHPPGEPEVFSPGLFRGLSGIGYALLRLSAPASIPSPLLMD